MPLFAYECSACHQEHEILVRGDTAPECPSCGSKDLVKQASAFAPMMGSASYKAAPTPCGAASCCQMQGGGCPLN